MSGTSATDYTTYTDGDLASPTLLIEDEDGSPLTPGSIMFYLRIGDATGPTTFDV